MNTTAAANNKTVKSGMSTRDVVLIGMFAVLLAAISQVSLPMPTGVPITIQVFGVTLVGVVLGWKRALFATIVYVLLGAVGLPVFAGFQGGLHVITGLTGGYILGWPVMAALCGATIPLKKPSAAISLLFSIILSVAGMLFVEAAGGLQWAMLAGDKSFGMIMAYSFAAFIPKDTILTIAAVIVGRQIRRTLSRGGFI